MSAAMRPARACAMLSHMLLSCPLGRGIGACGRCVAVWYRWWKKAGRCERRCGEVGKAGRGRQAAEGAVQQLNNLAET